SVDDGSAHSVTVYGEALDPSDKATAKAMSAAYKSAMVQIFCIPLCGCEDPDQSSSKTSARSHLAEPVQGWEQWARDIEDIIGVCESEQAIGLSRSVIASCWKRSVASDPTFTGKWEGPLQYVARRSSSGTG